MIQISGLVLRSTAWRIALSGVLLLSGCATTTGVADPRDPLEPLNRSVFAFNDAADKVLFKPAATLYRDLTPALVRAGVSNFLGNLDDVWSFVNSALQFKGQAAAQNFMRVNVNTVFGVGGIFDVASEARIERQREDFGQTLAVWGFPDGPYIVLPLFGPSILRDVVAWPVDLNGDLLARINHIPTRNTFKVLDQLDMRASFLKLGDALDDGALDKYTFTRDAFLQRRRNAVFDGNPPDLPDAATPKRP
ncbi:MAG: VacJ family lipoprotein [Rhodoferax sp.]|nr:VacJ family lipoprotein [Rhodoferax sp.]